MRTEHLNRWEEFYLKHSTIRMLLAATISLGIPALVHADTWQIDPAHTNVEFTVRHMMISNVKGSFEKAAGTVTVAGEGPATANIDVTIDASSLNTRVAKRDEDVKGPGFLDVARAGGHGEMESDGQPDAARRVQGSGAGRRWADGANQGSVRQHARGRVGYEQDRSARLWPDV